MHLWRWTERQLFYVLNEGGGTFKEVEVSGCMDGGDVDGSFAIESLENTVEVLHAREINNNKVQKRITYLILSYCHF